MTGSGWRRLWQGLAGLMGAAGVAIAAASAHLAEPSAAHLLDLAAAFLIAHALALIGLAALTRERMRWLTVAGVLFAIGAVCFGGGLVLRIELGEGFAPIIPVGGTALILGWLALALSAIADRPTT